MRLETTRLELREYVETDWERVHIYGSSKEFTRFEAWGPNSETDTKKFINEMIANLAENPRYKFEFAMIEKESGLLIGGCGLRREGSNSSVGVFGYAVNPEFQGKGFATEATKCLLEYGFKTLKLSVIYAVCDARNIASYTVMKKCGLNEVARFPNKRELKGEVNDELRFEILRDEYIGAIENE
jgi:RimJ/RimL family protein N-acetyltransferase